MSYQMIFEFYLIHGDAWGVMEEAQQHTFLILTKRPQRIVDWWNYYAIVELPNIYMGVTAENQQRADERIPIFLQIPGKKFLSIEPMLGEISFRWAKWHPVRNSGHLDGIKDINWVIVGAESGSNRRECKIEWIESIIAQCKSAGIPVFVKQIHINGKLVKDINQFPEHLRIRERPF